MVLADDIAVKTYVRLLNEKLILQQWRGGSRGKRGVSVPGLGVFTYVSRSTVKDRPWADKSEFIFILCENFRRLYEVQAPPQLFDLVAPAAPIPMSSIAMHCGCDRESAAHSIATFVAQLGSAVRSGQSARLPFGALGILKISNHQVKFIFGAKCGNVRSLSSTSNTAQNEVATTTTTSRSSRTHSTEMSARVPTSRLSGATESLDSSRTRSSNPASSRVSSVSSLPSSRSRQGAQSRARSSVLPHVMRLGNVEHLALRPTPVVEKNMNIAQQRLLEKLKCRISEDLKADEEMKRHDQQKWKALQDRDDQDVRHQRAHLCIIQQQAVENRDRGERERQRNILEERMQDPSRAYPCRVDKSMKEELEERHGWCHDLNRQVAEKTIRRTEERRQKWDEERRLGELTLEALVAQRAEERLQAARRKAYMKKMEDHEREVSALVQSSFVATGSNRRNPNREILMAKMLV
jgi:hypothetical protein